MKMGHGQPRQGQASSSPSRPHTSGAAAGGGNNKVTPSTYWVLPRVCITSSDPTDPGWPLQTLLSISGPWGVSQVAPGPIPSGGRGWKPGTRSLEIPSDSKMEQSLGTTKVRAIVTPN